MNCGANTELLMNPKRIGKRKLVQLILGLTILAWATQTLFQQWGFGATRHGASRVMMLDFAR